jgi:Na+/melibiose symporter-like transporter
MFGTASGLGAAMFHYMNNFFWELNTNQAGLLSASAFISALFALVLAPRMSRRMGKRRAVLIFGTIAFTCLPLPYFLRILGLFPANGTELLFHTLVVWNIFEVTLIITTQILGGSMLADLVEEAELDTGRRSEGVFFAASTFTRKLVTGLGVMLASSILSIVNLPTQADVATVDPALITQLGLLVAPSLLVLNLVGVAALSFYRIDQQTHEDNLSKIAAANGR